MQVLKELRNKEIVDIFLNQKKKPSDKEMSKWNMDMRAYYKSN